MFMQKIISIAIIASLIGAGFLIINQETNDGKILKTEDINGLENDSSNYCNFIEFNQEVLQLKKEVVQYKITFHQDDVIAVSSKMVALYVDETITSAYCLLTDGEKPLLEPVCLCYVPERRYLLVTPKIRVSVGKWWFVKIFKDTVGAADNRSGNFEVQAGDCWYLTLAVPTNSEKSYFSVTFQSLYDSMEITQLQRHSNVGIYSPTYQQFSGKFYSIKLGIFGGGSLCDSYKEITVTDGSVFHIFIAGHRKGTLWVNLPNGGEEQYKGEGLITYTFFGNESGNWKFRVKGWSFYFRMAVVLFYIDIDPHVKNV
jgi:hypothetical protein